MNESKNQLNNLCPHGPKNNMQPMKEPLKLVVQTGSIPSKKNHHYPGKSGRVLIDKEIKERMLRLENGIVFALCSLSQTTVSAMDSECRKRLLTLSFWLSDDSIREIPEFSFGVEYVKKGDEGVIIEIQEIETLKKQNT